MYKKYIKATSRRGMTLIELMVVVGIIAFLALLIVAYLRTQVFKGVDARRKGEIKRIAIAVEEYEKDNDCYPLPSVVSCNPGTGLLPYLDKVPCDPTSGVSYFYDHEDSVCPKWFTIYGILDNESDSDYVADIGPGGTYSFYYSSPNAPSVTSTPDEGGGDGGGIPDTDFFGCFSGSCQPISWDTSIPGTECEPSFQNSSCYSACIDASTGQAQNECN